MAKSDFYREASDLYSPLCKLALRFLSHKASDMIRVEETKVDNSEKSGTQYLLQANIFSGGVQDSFFTHFSKEASDQIKTLATIAEDPDMAKKIEEEKTDDEDQFVQAIIHEGKDKSVDALIDLLQWDLLRKSPAARAGGNKGMLMTR